MVGSFGAREIIIILVIVLILFGAPKLPDFARSLGKSMRIIKDETKALRDDDAPSSAAGSDAAEGESKKADWPDSTITPDDEGRGK